jgi:hypothetical protein
MKLRWLCALLPAVLLAACSAVPANSAELKHAPPKHAPPKVRTISAQAWGTITQGGNCLTGSPSNGTAVTGQTCDGSANQLWNLSLDGTLTLDAGGSAYCMDNANNGNPLHAQTWQCNYDNAQHWSWTPPGFLTAKGSGASFSGRWAMNGGSFPGYSTTRGAVSLHGLDMVVGSQYYLPVGINLNGTQYPYGTDPSGGTPGSAGNPWYLDGAGQPQYSSWEAQAEDQEDVAVSAWHANTVRVFISQDTLVDPSSGAVDHGYLAGLDAVVNHAQSLGLMVVLVDQTEADATSSANEPLPTDTTVEAWAALAPCFAGDDSVIIDPFNEPRSSSAMTDNSMWNIWLNGGRSGGVNYTGMNQLVDGLRGEGYNNLLWMETPGFSGNTSEQGLGRVATDFADWHVTDPDKLTVYEFHHPTSDGVARTWANWDSEFGNVVKHQQAGVVDGEWTNRSVTSGSLYPNGDAGQCWGDGPVTVPEFLRYLQGEGTGLLGWTLGTGDFHGNGILNDDGGDPASANSYGSSYSCVIPSGPTQGAGQDLQNWFGTLNP